MDDNKIPDVVDARVSRFVSNIEVSAIKGMAMRAAAVEDAASLTWGLPSFRTPAHIRAAVETQLEADPQIGKYALPDGLPELRSLIAKTHKSATGIEVNPDRNVHVTCGNMQGLNALFHVLLDPGDEVIVTDPGFASHFQQIRMVGATPVFWPMDETNGWSLDVEALSTLIGPRTKAIVLVTPSNPTGKIFREDELRRIGEIARSHSVTILLDDPYSHYTYENTDIYFNLASAPELQDTLVYLFTFSKTYAMSGWRLGYMILSEVLKKQVIKVHDATIICTPRISQAAGLAALGEEPVHLAKFEAVLSKRRDLICGRLDALPHVFDYVRPEGAYYVFPRILIEHDSSMEFAMRLLQEAKVVVTPGAAFGPTGENHVRMAFCVDEQTIDIAFDRIESLFGR
ncbi:MAG: pyridoxal phosphate-dependent aminotransferase [Hyphomicrobiales bacterium]|nr:pyridoxal phosphate-dependent aminotransferase [Hyphomicrobiales bacterium]